MSRFAGLGAGPVIGVGAAAVAAAVAIGAYFAGGGTPPPDSVEAELPAPAPETTAAPEPEGGDATAISQAPSAEPMADTEGDASAETASGAEAPQPPALDTFRLDPDGQLLVAGRALTGGEVAITVDDARLGTAPVDRAGKFVAFLDLAPSDRVRVLGLELLLEDGRVIPAPDEILIAPSPPPTPQPEAVAKADTSIPPAPAPETEAPATGAPASAVPDVSNEEAAPEIAQVLPEPTGATPGEMPEAVPGEAGMTGATGAVEAVATAGAETADAVPEPGSEPALVPEIVSESASEPEPAPEIAGTEPAAETVEPAARTPAAAPEPDTGGDGAAPPAETPAAPTVMVSDTDGVRVLQAPGEPGPEVMSSVALDAISYSTAGAVQLSGRASAPDAEVRIYLDNRAITTAPVDATGAWRSALPEVDTGIYTLRVDEVGAGGEVTSRIETPFKREDVATLSAQGAEETPAPQRMSVVTVQPGSTLWAISRETYGEGILYVRVFEANRDRIRDPDLIYPGQVFELPE